MIPVTSTDGVVVALHDLGGSGPPLLIAHATGFHGRAYAPMAEALADEYHCWAADLRGHGDATVPADRNFSWNGFADDVLAVIDHLGLEHLFAFGHSKGATALILAELARPGTFRALYLFEPIMIPPFAEGTSPFDGQPNPLAAAARRRREVFASHAGAYENFAGKPPLDVFRPDALRAYVDHGFASQPDGTVLLKCRGEDEASTYEMSHEHGAFTRLGEVTCPVAVAASGDGGMPATVAPLIADRLAHGHLEVFSQLSHFGPFQDPDAVADAALWFWRDQVADTTQDRASTPKRVSGGD